MSEHMRARTFIQKAREQTHPTMKDGVIVPAPCGHIIGYPARLRTLATHEYVCVSMMYCLTCYSSYLCTVEETGTTLIHFVHDMPTLAHTYRHVQGVEYEHENVFSYKRVPVSQASGLTTHTRPHKRQAYPCEICGEHVYMYEEDAIELSSHDPLLCSVCSSTFPDTATSSE